MTDSSAGSSERPGLRITRVYTKTGDKGQTRLVGGQSVAKDDPRIEAYGTIDELMVCMGSAREALAGRLDLERSREDIAGDEGMDILAGHLHYLQNLLFTLGGDLATRVEDRWPNMPLIVASDTEGLERLIDAYNDPLPPLKDFILPGGGPLALALHTCRVVCRRAERRLQTLAAAEPCGDQVVPFVNRLSDLFFVLARWAAIRNAAKGLGETETIWRRDLARPEALPPAE